MGEPTETDWLEGNDPRTQQERRDASGEVSPVDTDLAAVLAEALALRFPLWDPTRCRELAEDHAAAVRAAGWVPIEALREVGDRLWREGERQTYRRSYPAGVAWKEAASIVREALTRTACACPPCPGRGNDGHGLTHCAECCFGTGVEADIDCPIHGDAALTTAPEQITVPCTCDDPDCTATVAVEL